MPAASVAARFHHGLAEATARGLRRVAAERHGLEVVVLSGGVFQNRVLLERTRAELERARACACSSRERLPPNDGGIAYGQAAVAAARAAG